MKKLRSVGLKWPQELYFHTVHRSFSLIPFGQSCTAAWSSTSSADSVSTRLWIQAEEFWQCSEFTNASFCSQSKLCCSECCLTNLRHQCLDAFFSFFFLKGYSDLFSGCNVAGKHPSATRGATGRPDLWPPCRWIPAGIKKLIIQNLNICLWGWCKIKRLSTFPEPPDLKQILKGRNNGI